MMSYNKQQYYYCRYRDVIKQHGLVDIHTAYKNPSQAKKTIYNGISRHCATLNGKSLTVITRSCYMFSTGFLMPLIKLNKKTWVLVVDTPTDRQVIDLTEEQIAKLVKIHALNKEDL